MTGRHPRWTVDLLLGEPADSDHTLPEYAQEVRDRLTTAYETVRENLQTAAVAASDWYNRKTRLRDFCVGDKVRLYCPRQFIGRSPKLQLNYLQTGEILQKLNSSAYLMKTAKGRKIFHGDKLKLIMPYHEKQ